MFDKSKPGYLQMSSVFEELHHLDPCFNTVPRLQCRFQATPPTEVCGPMHAAHM